MSCTRSFVDHAKDLLSLVGPVEARRLFGGYGLYARGVLFGLLDDDELFVKTDEKTKGEFTRLGCRMWTYGEKKPDTRYFRPPDEAHEDAESMERWARLGLEAALRDAAEKARKAGVAKVRQRGPGGVRVAGKARPAAGPISRRRSQAR